jgi:hypothetical protein
MGMMKNYLLNVICACSDHQFGQDAVEFAIQMGLVKLTYNLDEDVKLIMSQYDDVIEWYRREVAQNEAVLSESYAPLLAVLDIDTPEGQRKDQLLFPPAEAA